MRFVTADYIFPSSSPPIKNGVIAIHDDGTIEDVLSPLLWRGAGGEASNLQTFKGIICPGFINSHCHLELSHLKGKLSEGMGLPHFIGEVISKREEKKEIIAEAIASAEDEMIRNGIVAVGDICNTADTISQKQKNRLRYHNFVEVFDLHPDHALNAFEKGKELQKSFLELNQSSSITPHAPYSVSKKLFKLINKNNRKHKEILSIHNQESASENEMFRYRSGALFEKLSSFGNTFADWKSTNESPLAYILGEVSDNKLLLVHNTFTSEAEVLVGSHYATTDSNTELHWCFCPKANLFIENRLPDIEMFFFNNCNIVIGTDSYASNWSLSILSELNVIQRKCPSISLLEILIWATLNAAEFFGWEKELGSIEKGKKPGLNLITNINEHTLSLTDRSEVKPLLH